MSSNPNFFAWLTFAMTVIRMLQEMFDVEETTKKVKGKTRK